MFEDFKRQFKQQLKTEGKDLVNYRKDFDTKVGAGIGAFAGLGVGDTLEDLWVKPDDSLTARLLKRIIAKGGSTAVGAFTGGIVGNKYGNNENINKLYNNLVRRVGGRQTGAYIENL